MSDAPQTTREYWDTYKPYRGEGPQPAPGSDRFDWTQYPGHGPGAEILGNPRHALDLGPAEGKEAAHLAQHGVDVTGVDFSPVQVARARALWEGTPRLSFVHAEACEFLAATTRAFDAIYSVWGVVWFTEPEDLFPLIAQRLNPGGTFAFSQAEPVTDSYGPQPMRGKWLEGRNRELTVLRWQYPPATWADMLKRHGFTGIDARVLPAPRQGDMGTLMVCARAPG